MKRQKLFLTTLLAGLLVCGNAWGTVTRPTVTGTTLTAKQITTTGWYIFKYVSGPTTVYPYNYYLTGYETAPVWNGSTTFIPCFTMTAYENNDSTFAQSFVYVEPKVTTAANGNQCVVQNSNGHYLDGSSAGNLGSTVRTSSSSNYAFLGWNSSSSDAKQKQIYFRTYNNQSNLAAMTLGGVKILGGTSNGSNLAFFNVVKVDLSSSGLTAWKVTLNGGTEASPLRGDTQVTYSGSGNYGHSKVYNNGTFFLDSDVTPAADNFSVPTKSGYEIDIQMNTSQHTITVSYIISKKDVLNLAEAALALKGIGYPAEGSDTRTALETAVTTLKEKENPTLDDISTLQTAITTYKSATSDIQLPESGKVYQFVNVQYSGKKYALIYDATNAQMATDSTSLDNAVNLLCQKNDDSTYVFRLPNGKYLRWRGNGNYSTDTIGCDDSYTSTWNNLTISKIVKGTNDKITPSQDGLFGYVNYIGRRVNTTGDTNEFNRTIIAKSGSFDQANVDFFNDSHSSAFLITENESLHVYKVVFTEGSASNATLIFNNTLHITNGEKVPYFASDKEITSSNVAEKLVPSGLYKLEGVYTIEGNVITVKCVEKQEITYNITVTGNDAATVTYNGTEVPLTSCSGSLTLEEAIDMTKFSASLKNDYVATTTLNDADITVAYTQLPFKTSNDLSTPYYYGMKTAAATDSRRWLTYNTTLGYANRVATETLDSDNQLWSFNVVQAGDGSHALTIAPKTGKGKVLTYPNTNNGNQIIADDLSTTSNKYIFTFVTTSRGNTGFSPYGVSTYLNCYQGGNNNVGFYTTGPDSDTGSKWSIKSIQTIEISAAGWATGCLPFKAKVVSGNATAKYVSVSNNTLSKKDVTNIASGEGFLLKQDAQDGNACIVYFAETTGDAATESNQMVGTTDTNGHTFNDTGYKYYILANDPTDGIGFYWQSETGGSSATCPQYKAVLKVPSSTTPSIKGFSLEDDTETGISEVNANVDVNANTIYNLAGQRVNMLQKGINIVNGKKVLY